MKQEDYGLVYCHFLYTLGYVPEGANARIILDAHNVDRQYWARKGAEGLGWKSVLAHLNVRRLERYEAASLARLWAHVSVSEEDRELTRCYSHEVVRHMWVAPNGVDTSRFSPSVASDLVAGQPVTLGFLGSLDLDTNVRAAHHLCTSLFPEIRARVPQATLRLLVIGRNPPPTLRNIERKQHGVLLAGTVPDVQPWLKKVDILVLPLSAGGGTKLRVLEAMACALPVVGTPIALQGLKGQDGVHFCRASNDAEIIDAVCELLASPCRRVALGCNARALVEKRYDWSAVTEALARRISRCIESESAC